MPLEESPKPKQIWRRGRDLQGKKIISYEEGGSNGLLESESRSTIALVLTSSASTSGDPVEAWCLSVGGGLTPLCVSPDVLGAALFNPDLSAMDAFEPFVVTLSSSNTETDEINLDICRLMINPDMEAIEAEQSIAHAVVSHVTDVRYSAPAMAMGTAPAAFCLCCQTYIIVILRDQGYLVAYRYVDGKLNFVDETKLGRYVVDAAIRIQQNGSEGVDVVTLLCDTDDIKDGRMVTISISCEER